MLYNNCPVMFGVMGSYEEGCAPQWQPTCYAGSSQVVQPGGTGHGTFAQEALEFIYQVVKAPHYTTSTMFNRPHTMMDYCQCYRLKEEEPSGWPEVWKSKLETVVLTQVFRQVSLRVMEVPEVVRPPAPSTQVMESEDIGIAVT